MSVIKGSWNNNVALPIKCPECGHTTNELISKLQQDNTCVCAGCGKSIVITGDALAVIEGVKKAITGFK